MGITRKLALFAGISVAVKYFGDFKEGPRRRRQAFAPFYAARPRLGMEGVAERPLKSALERFFSRSNQKQP